MGRVGLLNQPISIISTSINQPLYSATWAMPLPWPGFFFRLYSRLPSLCSKHRVRGCSTQEANAHDNITAKVGHCASPIPVGLAQAQVYLRRGLDVCYRADRQRILRAVRLPF